MLLDQIPLLILFTVLVVLMISFVEIGFMTASRLQRKNKAQIAQVRAIMGASLGLLGFMLAFSYSMAQRHFEERNAAYLVEVSEIDLAYRSAELLGPNDREQAKALLRKFVQTRVAIKAAADQKNFEVVIAKISESEDLHKQLWAIAASAQAAADESVDPSRFADSILAMIRAHDARLQAGLFNRIPAFIWYTLFFMSLISMLIMGYQAGLTDARSRLATWSLALTFAIVMMLVTDLDRPVTTFFKMNQQLLAELQERME